MNPTAHQQMDIRLHEVVRIVLEVLSLFFQEA